MDYNGEFPGFAAPTSTQSTSAPTASRKRKHARPCDICGEISHGAHFGAEACRACTAFFRRSIAQNRKYTCRNGKSCEVLARDRRMCRACRLKKCIEAGMQKTAVQRYEVGSDGNEDSGDCPMLEDNEVEIIEDKTPTLTRLTQQYEEVKKVRKVLHGKKKKVPKSVSFLESDAINLKEVGLIADFLSKSFEETNQLEEDQRKLMFKMFLRQFIVLEGGYLASLRKNVSAMILPNGDMIDFERPETFFPPATGSSMVSQEEALKLFSPIFDLYKRCIMEPLTQIKIDETEFLFLCGTLFWDSSYEHQSKECGELAKSTRNRIIDEMVLYLKKKKEVKEPAVRISALMMILTALQRVVFKLQQDIEMSHAFNVYKVDDNFYNIVNCNF